MSDITVAAVQTIQHWEDKGKNLAHFENLLAHSDLSEVDVLVFPEMFHTGFSMHVETLHETMENSLGITWLQQQAKMHHCLCIASLIIKENNTYRNRMVAAFPSGKIEYYDKQHLFSMAGENNYYTAGTEQKIISYNGWNILLQVCFDLRFPEGSRNKVLKNNSPSYDLVIYVANWPEKRSAHWEALLPARAIENQCYVVGVNRIGIDGNGHKYSGKTVIYDALGNRIASETEAKEIVLIAQLQQEALHKTRDSLPFLKEQN